MPPRTDADYLARAPAAERALKQRFGSNYPAFLNQWIELVFLRAWCDVLKKALKPSPASLNDTWRILVLLSEGKKECYCYWFGSEPLAKAKIFVWGERYCAERLSGDLQSSRDLAKSQEIQLRNRYGYFQWAVVSAVQLLNVYWKGAQTYIAAGEKSLSRFSKAPQSMYYAGIMVLGTTGFCIDVYLAEQWFGLTHTILRSLSDPITTQIDWQIQLAKRIGIPLATVASQQGKVQWTVGLAMQLLFYAIFVGSESSVLGYAALTYLGGTGCRELARHVYERYMGQKGKTGKVALLYLASVAGNRGAAYCYPHLLKLLQPVMSSSSPSDDWLMFSDERCQTDVERCCEVAAERLGFPREISLPEATHRYKALVRQHRTSAGGPDDAFGPLGEAWQRASRARCFSL